MFSKLNPIKNTLDSASGTMDSATGLIRSTAPCWQNISWAWWMFFAGFCCFFPWMIGAFAICCDKRNKMAGVASLAMMIFFGAAFAVVIVVALVDPGAFAPPPSPPAPGPSPPSPAPPTEPCTFTSCSTCTSSNGCIWCSSNPTNKCMSGDVNGPTSGSCSKWIVLAADC